MVSPLTKEQKEKLDKLTRVEVGWNCPHCRVGIMKIKNSKYGKFLACDGYPYCAFKKPYVK